MALSIGYAAGGHIADRYPSRVVFAGTVFLAGLLTFPIPVLATPVLEAVARFDLGPQLNPLVSSLALFFLPSIVMGMVSPFAVRLRAQTLTMVGRTAGALYTISAIGSIVGTLASAFVLISFLGVREIIYILGLTLMIVAALGWLWDRKLAASAAAGVLIVLLTASVAQADLASELIAAAGPDRTVVYARDGLYQRVTVIDEGAIRFLRMDNVNHSAIYLDRPLDSPLTYIPYMHLPLIFASEPKPRRMTLIGLGGGTLASRYAADYPPVAVEVAEIDPEVVGVAQRYFGLLEGDRLRIGVRDGRLHLQQTRTPQDVILTDAYLKDKIPFHLATREFFALARSRLPPGGVIGANVIGTLEGPDSRLFRAIYKTMREVLPTVYVFPIYYTRFGAPESRRNIVLVATTDQRLSADEIFRRARALVEARVVTVDRFLEAAGDIYQAPVSTADVPTLSDNFAPVDLLLLPG
jgi:spermidine synthase